LKLISQLYLTEILLIQFL